jgi:ribulose-bisphosphate carboxylase large chain
MSVAGLPDPQDPAFYQWNDMLSEADYLRVRYEITASCDGVAAAVGMAMDQSVGTTHIEHYLDADALAAFCTRVRSVTPLPEKNESPVAAYHLATPTYVDSKNTGGSYAIELSVPLCLLVGKTTQLWNILVGELPRLGFITRFSLVAAPLPQSFGVGPAFGVAGLRALTQRPAGPLLCRAMRPATGASDELMAAINYDVLAGGFHIVKDDELQAYATFEIFAAHVRAMLEARDTARSVTGEPKLYIANLICEPWELNERWDLCCALGVDGVLIAPWIQGLGTLNYLAKQARMPIFAHNTLGELFTRHPDWNVSPAVLNHWLRVLGADIIVTEGDFGDTAAPTALQREALSACVDSLNGMKTTLPVLQGGKNPDGLLRYRKAVGSDDFMLIVASWVDNHPQGLREGAKAFRRAIDAS